MTIVLLVIVALVVAAGLAALVSYNGLIRVRNRVEAAWAQIEVQLTRRHDLIPNLVETVKGYATHERETLDAVVQARNRAVAANGPVQQAAAEDQVSGALATVFALSEAYPDLKANQNFLGLQEELTSTEDRVGYARQYYNDAVNAHNTKIQSFPAVVMAKRMGFGPRQYFQAEGDARGPVQVDF